MTGIVFDIKEFSIHDGPGARVTVFMKGCPLRCRWCHNPEGLERQPQLMYKEHLCAHCELCRENRETESYLRYGRDPSRCPKGLLSVSGTEYGVEELTSKLLSYAPMLKMLDGGITFSGGEPLTQKEFVRSVADRLRAKGIHTAMETAGFAPEESLRETAESMDLVIMDLKLMNDGLHREYTGVSNEIILKNARWLKESGIAHIFRTPMIPGITDTEENLGKIRDFAGDSHWEKIPYNNLAGAKYPLLGMEYQLKKGENQ